LAGNPADGHCDLHGHLLRTRHPPEPNSPHSATSLPKQVAPGIDLAWAAVASAASPMPPALFVG
jgi:hypothetical protein